jgi:predicted secreted acid phosphatase
MPLFGPHTHRHDHKHSRLIDMLIKYHDSGDYLKDHKLAASLALEQLNRLEKLPENPALVLDIDETSLFNNWSKLIDPIHGYDEEKWNEQIKNADAPPIETTLVVFNACRERGFECFFITGRPEHQREYTVKNLEKAGFGAFKELFLEPEGANYPSASLYKTERRKQITDQGYNIVLNMGDQQSDLAGGLSQVTYKLPNPFYFIS